MVDLILIAKFCNVSVDGRRTVVREGSFRNPESTKDVISNKNLLQPAQ